MSENLHQASVPILLGWLLLTSSGIALGAEVYKWVDEQGKVHYGDHRSSQEAESLKLRSSPASDPANEEQRLEQQKLLESYAEKRKEKQLKAAEIKKERENRRQNCDKAKVKMYAYEHARYLYDVDKEGNRRILSDEEHAKASQTAKGAVDHWCKQEK